MGVHAPHTRSVAATTVPLMLTLARGHMPGLDWVHFSESAAMGLDVWVVAAGPEGLIFVRASGLPMPDGLAAMNILHWGDSCETAPTPVGGGGRVFGSSHPDSQARDCLCR